MKLKLVNIESNCTTESDYETAVDLSHSTINENTYILETLSGLELKISETDISTSYSSLEPDFEALEKNPNDLHYVTYHREDNKSDFKSFCHMEYCIANKLILMSKQDYKDYFINYENKTWTEKEQIDKKNKNKFSQYEESLYSPSNQGFSLESDEAKEFIQNIDKVLNLSSGKRYKKGMFYEIEVPESLKNLILKLDEENIQVNTFNSLHIMQDRVNKAQALIELSIDNSYNNAIKKLKP